MDRYFIIVVEDLGALTNLGELEKVFVLIKDYQQLALKSSQILNTANSLPTNSPLIEWTLCVGETSVIFKGSSLEEFQGLISSSFTADLPSESWDSKSFNHLSNRAVDILLNWSGCPDFWKSFNPSNIVEIIQGSSYNLLNPKLFWRGTLKMRDPHNPSNFGQLDHAELSYDFDKLDLVISQVKRSNYNILSSQRKTFCPFLELTGAFSAHSVPFIFYSATSLTLTVLSADSFWNSVNENVSFLFRLDYASEDVDQWDKEIGAQSIHFLSHWTGGQLKLFVLKSTDQLQNLANVFARSAPAFPVNMTKPVVANAACLKIDRMESEVRRLQLLAIESWLEENGSIDPVTMDELLTEVAFAVANKDQRHRFISDSSLEAHDCSESTEADLLKWKLDKKEMKKTEAANQNRLLSGRAVTVDVNHLLRCFNRNKPPLSRSPGLNKNRGNHTIVTQLKPTVDLETARTCAAWPQCTQLKYHGINYNLSTDDEKAEKLRTEYQDKWVSTEAAFSCWCNPWSFNSSSTYQLTTSNRNHQISAVPEGARTPRKQGKVDLSQLRKSPRLLAKTSRLGTRRTPSKKNPNGGAATGSATNNNKDTFKQQLKTVIIKVLADQQIGTKDPLFRTCANKLSVICMALLKDSKTVVSQRQMFQVAKSQAKQVLQFVKP